MILLCFIKHQGAPSLHSGDLKIQPTTDRGTDGPCDFYARNPHTNHLEIAFAEASIGVSVAVGA